MPTAIVTYLDRDGSAPRISVRGVDFVANEPVELDVSDHAALLAKAARNANFLVESDTPVALPVAQITAPYAPTEREIEEEQDHYNRKVARMRRQRQARAK